MVMGFAWFAGMIGFALAMAGSPGPNNTTATASGASYGMARSLPLVSGVGFGVAAIMLVVAAFGASIIADPRVGTALKWVGVAYLVWLAWKIARAEPKLDTSDNQRATRAKPLSFVQGALFQFVNPKLWVMVSGAVVAYGQGAGEIGKTTLALLFALVFGGITFLCTLAWAALGASLGRFLASPRAVRTFNYVMAALLMASLIPIVWE
jgi:threonine/homoserine/homoserine lactone efflux protein